MQLIFWSWQQGRLVGYYDGHQVASVKTDSETTLRSAEELLGLEKPYLRVREDGSLTLVESFLTASTTMAGNDSSHSQKGERA
jgi:hypothetical protein